MAKRHYSAGKLPSGPPSKTRRKASSDKPMVADSPLVAASTGRDFSDRALSSIAEYVPRILAAEKWRDDHTDTAFKSVLEAIYHAVATFARIFGPCPESLVSFKQFRENLAKKSASRFINLLRKALKEDNRGFWHPVMTHGKPLTWDGPVYSLLTSRFLDVFHVVIPNDPNPTSSESRVPVNIRKKVISPVHTWR